MMLLCSQSFARYNAYCHWLISDHVVSAKFRWISRGPKVYHARAKSLPRVGYNSMSRKKIVSMDFLFFSSPSLKNKTLHVWSGVLGTINGAAPSKTKQECFTRNQTLRWLPIVLLSCKCYWDKSFLNYFFGLVIIFR